jgi:Carboxypeptidase regulatory-like domain
MRRSSPIFVLVLLAVALCAQTSPPHHFRIAGTVVNALTGQPLPDAQLSIDKALTSDTLQTVRADSAGRFIFEVTGAGKYVLIGQAHGFDRQSLDEHSQFSTAVVVGPDKDSENVLFHLAPDASISGVITDEANEPVREAQVMLFHRATEEGRNAIRMRTQTRPDDQGHYRFAHLSAGTYFVVVSARPWYVQTNFMTSAEGDSEPSLNVTYPVAYYSGATESSAATPITLKPGDRMVADIGLAAIPTVNMDVMIPGSNSQNVPAVYLTQQVFDDIPVSVQGRNHLLQDGVVRITGVPPGQLQLNVMSGKDGSSSQQPVNVTGNSMVQVKTSGAASISGTVSLGGRPVSQGFVVLTDHGGSSGGAKISAKGGFEFSGVPFKPGTYELAVFDVPDAGVASVAATGATVRGRNLEIPGSDLIQLNIVMSKGLGRIDGTALRDGKPMSGAMIVLVPDDLEHNRSMIRRDQSDSDGTFTLPGILPGNYTVIALQKGWDMEWQNPSVLAPYLKSGESVAVSQNQRYQVKVNVQ